MEIFTYWKISQYNLEYICFRLCHKIKTEPSKNKISKTKGRKLGIFCIILGAGILNQFCKSKFGHHKQFRRSHYKELFLNRETFLPLSWFFLICPNPGPTSNTHTSKTYGVYSIVLKSKSIITSFFIDLPKPNIRASVAEKYSVNPFLGWNQ